MVRIGYNYIIIFHNETKRRDHKNILSWRSCQLKTKCSVTELYVTGLTPTPHEKCVAEKYVTEKVATNLKVTVDPHPLYGNFRNFFFQLT